MEALQIFWCLRALSNFMVHHFCPGLHRLPINIQSIEILNICAVMDDQCSSIDFLLKIHYVSRSAMFQLWCHLQPSHNGICWLIGGTFAESQICHSLRITDCHYFRRHQLMGEMYVNLLRMEQLIFVNAGLPNSLLHHQWMVFGGRMVAKNNTTKTNRKRKNSKPRFQQILGGETFKPWFSNGPCQWINVLLAPFMYRFGIWRQEKHLREIEP